MIELVSHFASKERSRNLEPLRQKQWFIKAKQEAKQRTDVEDRLEGDVLAFAAETITATQIQIEAFEARLDSYGSQLDKNEAQLLAYDTAIVEALMENRRRLDQIGDELNEVDAELESLLEQAHVHEDGRRLFKSRDGLSVIDETGENVSLDEIDVDSVFSPASELYTDGLARRRDLQGQQFLAEQERSELLDAQEDIAVELEGISESRENLGQARERAASGDMTVKEMEEFDAELEDAMSLPMPKIPASAMKHITGIESAIDTPNATTAFTNNADPAAALQSPNHNPAFQPG